MSKNKYKVPNWVKNIIKTELYHYWQNKKILETMKVDIIEESPSPADGQPKGNKTTNVTEQKVIEINSNRTIIETEKRINYIEQAFKMLNEDEKKIAEMIFKDRYNAIIAETQKHISKHTYYHVYDKAIYYTALEFGYI